LGERDAMLAVADEHGMLFGRRGVEGLVEGRNSIVEIVRGVYCFLKCSGTYYIMIYKDKE
jgi:hypothetical protein